MLVHVWAKKMKIFKILYTKYMEICEVMTSSTHSFAYRLFKKCTVENYKNTKFHIFLIFYPIYIKFSVLCENLYSWIDLNLARSSSFSADKKKKILT